MWCLDHISFCENLLWSKKEIIPHNILTNITILNYMKRISNCKGSSHVIIFVFTLCSSSSINLSSNQVKVHKPSAKKYAKNFIISIMYIFIKHNVLWYKKIYIWVTFAVIKCSNIDNQHNHYMKKNITYLFDKNCL